MASIEQWKLSRAWTIWDEARDPDGADEHIERTARAEDWKFYCDSDFAGNTEPQNKRRSQNGYIAIHNTAPMFWASKA